MKQLLRSRAVAVSGTVGVGKTTVAEAIGELLRERSRPHAVIDLDWLRRGWPAPADDPFNAALGVQNLRSVVANYVAAGAQRLVLAGVVGSVADRAACADAVGGSLSVCRLVVEHAEIRERLARRHALEAAGLAWHLNRLPELDSILDDAGVEDFTVHATGRTHDDVAAEILLALGS